MIRIVYIENDVFKSVLMPTYFRVHIPFYSYKILITINRLPMATETSFKNHSHSVFCFEWLMAVG